MWTRRTQEEGLYGKLIGTDQEGNESVQEEKTPSSVCCECLGSCEGKNESKESEHKQDVRKDDEDDRNAENPDDIRPNSDTEESCDGEDEESAAEDTPVVNLTCCVCAKTDNIRVCGGCKETMYCSRKCQKSHREYHATYCAAITDLKKLELDKIYGKKKVQQNMGDWKLRKKIMKLVGEKPMLDCFLAKKECQMLWDTGSQISMVDRGWVRKYFPEEIIYPSSLFVDEELHVQAANATTINYDGVILLDFSLSGHSCFDVRSVF